MSTESSPAESSFVRMMPEPKLRGVSDLPLLRNPTFWVALIMAIGWLVGWAGYLSGLVPTWLAITVNSVADYLGFTVLHESVHRINLKNRSLNDLLGYLPAFMLVFTYPVFRIAHLQHHAHTNDPKKDPDHWVSHRPRILLPFWLISTAGNYRRLFFRNKWGTPGQRYGQVALDAILIIGTVTAALFGQLFTVLVLYWLPWLIGGMFLVYAFDFLPHHPFSSQEKYLDTRIQPGRVRNVLLLGQNYHLIHHLWVSTPWFHYKKIFEDFEVQLRAHGARID